MNEIATKTGLETSGCSNQIAALITLGIVSKEVPITESTSSKKTLYHLDDNMFLFWYRFVRPNLSSIIRGIGETIYETLVRPQISDFMGSVFEEICKQYLYLPEVYVSLPFPIGNSGRWWGNNPAKKRQEEIDIMAVQEENGLFCECKWKNAPVALDVVLLLKERGELFHYKNKYYIIFSKSGFTEQLVKYAELHNDAKLISFDNINRKIFE